ncbi:MAG: T9SS type A sorting domain-containing protein [Bacteroidia bacterium]|nr:T9SS type A sorting domain-containing protein [Bacteroidia bacterium]
MKDYSFKTRVLWVSLILMLSGISLMGQFVIPQGRDINKEFTFKDAMKAYDQWVSVPGNIDQKGWKAYGRFMEFNRSRLNPDGNPADPTIFESEVINIQAQKQMQASLKTGNGWSPVGPDKRPPSVGTYSSHGMGRINCISFHPTDPLIYWIGVAQGGVWKTTDGGNTYMPLTDDLPILRISDIAVNPKNPDNIFISVCDYAYIGVALNTDSRKRHTHYGLGVYRTDDGGITWRPTGLSFNQTDFDASLIRRILFHPTQPGTLVAAGVSGIFKSTDDGVNWHKVNSDVIWDIEQDFNSGLVIYATTGTIRSFGGGSPKLLKTTDFGETWVQKNTNWPTDLSIGRTEIGLTPQNSNCIYIVAANPEGTFYGLYRSTDAGETWTARNTAAVNGQNVLENSQGWYDLAILVDPKNQEKVYVGGLNMQASADGGLSWNAVSNWYMISSDNFTLHADQHQYKYNPVDQKYYACHDGGVDRTDTIIPGNRPDGKYATTWQERSNGMIITSFYRIGLCEMFPGYVVGGAQDNSSFYNRNGDWINFIGGDGMDCMINPDNPDIVYGSSQYGSLVRSDNGGDGFTSIRPNVGSEKGEWTTPMIQDMNNPNIIFVGYGNVYKSINKGNTYTKISSFPTVSGYNSPAEITALAMYPGNNKTLYAASRIRYDYPTPTKLWATQNGGAGWKNIIDGIPDSLYITSLAVNGSDSLDLWVTYGGFLSGQHVYRTVDGGTTWKNMTMDLPNIPVNTVVHQEGYGNDVVYIGTDAGVYYYTDESGKWTLYSNLLPNVVISELEIHSPSRKLYAATFGRGIWMANLVQGTSGTEPTGFISSKLSVYPNPTNGAINLQINGIQTSEARIEMISITGERVYEETFAVGDGTIQKQLHPNLVPGMYFIRVWAGKQHLTERIIKL